MSKATSDVTDGLILQAFDEQGSAKATLSDKRGLSASIPEILGAIAIGVVVLATTGFGIAAGYNYSQDSSAKSLLESVKSAQTLYQSKNQTFGALTDLTSGTPAALDGNPTNVAITADTTDYCAVSKSGSMGGTEYWITAKSGTIVTLQPTAAQAGVTCPTLP
ncbi:hypothetical protein ACFVU2_19005 [Leifsonia sp. NPDC058194]|uniref:hypothetical protein n=1 Tax=Leifsonia sp. NPDC058194 TaxID=3346374 RepID=UPI0036DB46DE